MYFTYIQRALKAAKYHEDRAFSFAHPEVNKYDEVVFHLRAYFWELWSVWDYILQLANSETLRLDPEDVRRKFLKKLKAEQPNYKYLTTLEKIQSNERLLRIKSLRDHAHKWQIDPYLIEYNENSVSVIALNNLDSKNRKLARQINIDKNDLGFMVAVVRTLTEKGFK